MCCPADYALLRFTPSQVGLGCFMLVGQHYCGGGWVLAVCEALACLTAPPGDVIAALSAVFTPRAALDPRKSPEAITLM